MELRNSLYDADSVDSVLEWNEGNHFREPIEKRLIDQRQMVIQGHKEPKQNVCFLQPLFYIFILQQTN